MGFLQWSDTRCISTTPQSESHALEWLSSTKQTPPSSSSPSPSPSASASPLPPLSVCLAGLVWIGHRVSFVFLDLFLFSEEQEIGWLGSEIRGKNWERKEYDQNTLY